MKFVSMTRRDEASRIDFGRNKNVLTLTLVFFLGLRSCQPHPTVRAGRERDPGNVVALLFLRCFFVTVTHLLTLTTSPE